MCYTHMHASTHTHITARKHTHTHTCTHTHTRTHTHTHTHTHMHTHTHTCTRTHAHTHTQAKRQRPPAKPCTPLPSTNMDKRHVHPPQTVTAVRAQPVIVSHTQQVDAILTRMAQSTNNAVRKISMMDRDNCSPVRANLSEQFSQVQDKHPKDSTDTPSTPSHTSRDSTDTPSHTPRDSTDTPSTPSHTPQDSVDRPSAPSHTRAHPDPGVGTRHIPLAVAVRTVCNYYECEPELVGLVFRHYALETRSSGRRNPVGVALASVDKYAPTECFFTTIEGTAQSTC